MTCVDTFPWTELLGTVVFRVLDILAWVCNTRSCVPFVLGSRLWVVIGAGEGALLCLLK